MGSRRSRAQISGTRQLNADRDISVHHDIGGNRFETTIEGQIAFVNYIRRGDTIWYTHTEVPPALAGMGIGSALAKHVLDYAMTNSLKVVPTCPFIAQYIETHPEYAPLLKGPSKK